MKNTFDFLVIGSGIAGLHFALEASKHGTVGIVTKKELMESNSNYAQGGIASVLDSHDSFENHIDDTLRAGCFLNDKVAVEIMVKEAPTQIQKLIDIGVGFTQNKKKLDLTQEGGHSQKRIAHAKDATGKEIERALLHHIRNIDTIKTFESHVAFELTLEGALCYGALVYNEEKKETEQFFAKATIVATGGAGQVYKRNSNPKIATGDGVAMAYHVGARIKDMEFVQFHPTTLAKAQKPTFLISETVRGEGGILKNVDGIAFMEHYHEKKDLAPRDIVTRAIFHELKRGPVFLDIRSRGAEYIKKRFPYIYEQLWWYGIKMDKDPIPVAPAAHYMCGGIETTVNGETNIKGLYAFGEVARTGVHGANRLASNSLLECLVFSGKAVGAATKYIHTIDSCHTKKIDVIETNQTIDPSIDAMKNEIQSLMWKNVGIVREKKKMERALQKLNGMKKNIQKIYSTGVNANILELKNIHTVATLITHAALERKESVGTHFVKHTQ